MALLPEQVEKAYKAWQTKPGDDTAKAFTEAMTQAETEATAAAEKNKPPEKYDFAKYDGPYETAADLKSIEDLAKKNGLTLESAEAIRTQYQSIREGQTKSLLAQAQLNAKTAGEKNKAEFLKTYGDKANEVATKAMIAAKKLLPEAVLKSLEENGLTNNLDLVKQMAEAHDKYKLGEATVPQGNGIPDTKVEMKEAMFPMAQLAPRT